MTNDGMPRFPALVVMLTALAASSSSRAQVTANPCDPACVDDGGVPAVSFCDEADAGPSAIACAPDGGVTGSDGCASIPAVDGGQPWGPDCVLGEGAPCDPGYAFGASRCDPDKVDSNGHHLFCVGDVCTFAASKPGPEAPLEPSAGTHTAPSSTTNCFGCNNTSTAGAVMFGAALLSLRRLRRRG
jgi:hypothetical protein